MKGWEIWSFPPTNSLTHQLQKIQQCPAIAHVEPDYIVATTAIPDDPEFADGAQWSHLNQGQLGGLPGADIHAVEGWATLHDASQVVVAVIDTGLRLSHVDIAPNVWRNSGEIPGNGQDDDANGVVDDIYGYNAPANSGNMTDPLGHGTHVSGIIGAVGNNGIGIAGTAWRTQIMMCRYVDDTGEGAVSDIVKCFQYARTMGAQIINASLVVTNESAAFQSVVEACRNAGIIVACGAGNSSLDNDISPHYPANYEFDNIVAVAATSRWDELEWYSNFGARHVHLAAPGSELRTLSSGSDTGYFTTSGGTSFATALVSGALALLKARHPFDTHTQIIHRLLNSVDRLPSLSGKCTSEGRLNLAKALGPPVTSEFLASPLSGSAPLTVQFTNQSFGAISEFHWSFSDGTSSSLPHPSHTFTREGSYPVQLTVIDNQGIPHIAEQIIRVLPNYTISLTTLKWMDPDETFTLVPIGTNGLSDPIRLPFPFEIYYAPQTQVVISSQGWLSWGPSAPPTVPDVPLSLPDARAPQPLIAPWWDQLSFSPNRGAIHYGVVGSAPNRKCIVTWRNATIEGGNSPNVSFQVQLEETSHRIFFEYLEVAAEDPGPAGAGKRATIGIQNSEATQASVYSNRGSSPLSNGLALAFTPPTPYPGYLIAEPQANPLWSAIVGSDSEDVARFSFSYQLRNAGFTPLLWTATVSEPWIKLEPARGTLPPNSKITVTLSLLPALLPDTKGLHSNPVRFFHATSSSQGNLIRSPSLELFAPLQLSLSNLGTHLSLALSPGDPLPTFAIIEVQSSTNLNTWTPFTLLPLPHTSPLPWELPSTSVGAMQFFRARWTPRLETNRIPESITTSAPPRVVGSP